MQIFFHKQFEKEYVRLAPKQKFRVKEALVLFENNPHDPVLEIIHYTESTKEKEPFPPEVIYA